MCLIPSKGQDQCQVKSGHQMKMLHECRAAHVLSDTWELQFNGGIYFLILPRKGQGQANLGLISKFQIFLQKRLVLASFVSGFQKRIYFHARRLDMPNVLFSKVTSSPLLGF